MASTRLMTKFLKRLKNGEFNLNPGNEILARPLSDIHFKFMPFTRQGTVRLNDTILFMLISKLQGMYIWFTALQIKCHVDRELSQNFVAYSVYLACY